VSRKRAYSFGCSASPSRGSTTPRGKNTSGQPKFFTPKYERNFLPGEWEGASAKASAKGHDPTHKFPCTHRSEAQQPVEEAQEDIEGYTEVDERYRDDMAVDVWNPNNDPGLWPRERHDREREGTVHYNVGFMPRGQLPLPSLEGTTFGRLMREARDIIAQFCITRPVPYTPQPWRERNLPAAEERGEWDICDLITWGCTARPIHDSEELAWWMLRPARMEAATRLVRSAGHQKFQWLERMEQLWEDLEAQDEREREYILTEKMRGWARGEARARKEGNWEPPMPMPEWVRRQMEVEQESFRRFQERQARMHPEGQPEPWQEEEATGTWRLWRHSGAHSTFISHELIQVTDANELQSEWEQRRAWERELATGVVEPPEERATSSRSAGQ
jgi:hypothetical protein